MGDPGAVMSEQDLSLLVRPHLFKGEAVRLFVVLNRDVGRHPTYGVSTSTVAGPNQQLHVRSQEGSVHRHRPPIREDESRMLTEFLDEREDVVPPTTVQSRGMLFQLVENLVHLERGGERLDEDGRLYGAPRNAELLLGDSEDVVPESRLQMTLHLWKIEVGGCPLL